MKIVTGPDLHPGQLRAVELIKNPEYSYVSVLAPRQTGKSFLAMQCVLYWAINFPGSTTFWIAPTWSQSKKPFEQIFDAVVNSGLLESANKSDVTLKFKNGSVVKFKQADRADSIRGETGDFMVCDEFAFFKDDVWSAVLRPIMLVRGRCTLFISTPNGHNTFKEMFDLGQSKDPEHSKFASCRMHYSDNPFVDQQEIEIARKTLPPQIFAAEYEGSFEESGRTVFTLDNMNYFNQWPRPQGKVVGAVDWGRANDWTVAVFMDSNGHVVDVYRENKTDWSLMVAEIAERAKKWNASMLCEQNSIGDVLVEQLKAKWADTHPFITSNKSKKEIIEGLILDINEGSISIPHEDLFQPLAFELRNYEYQYSAKTRTVTYNAPSSMHDDTVIAICLANYHRKKNINYGSYNYFVR